MQDRLSRTAELDSAKAQKMCAWLLSAEAEWAELISAETAQLEAVKALGRAFEAGTSGEDLRVLQEAVKAAFSRVDTAKAAHTAAMGFSL
jgi:hypothetical protein